MFQPYPPLIFIVKRLTLGGLAVFYRSLLRTMEKCAIINYSVLFYDKRKVTLYSKAFLKLSEWQLCKVKVCVLALDGTFLFRSVFNEKSDI